LPLLRNSTNLFLSEYLSPPIRLTLPFLLSPLTFFRLPFLHQFFLLVTLKLNLLSSQNHICKRSGVSFSIFKDSTIFVLNAVFLYFSWTPGYILPTGKHTFFALISSELIFDLILFLWTSPSMLLISALSI
jgi:hypothetical protein